MKHHRHHPTLACCLAAKLWLETGTTGIDYAVTLRFTTTTGATLEVTWKLLIKSSADF